MKKHDSRTALRLPSQQRREIERLIKEGQFENISSVIRAALKQFLENS